MNLARTNPPRIAILGAGLMGRMLAVALTQKTLNNAYCVALFDQDAEQGHESAAYLAAAMLAPLAESADASKNIMLMGEHSLELWPKFLDTLAAPVFFQRQGSLILSYDQDHAYLLDFQRRLKRQDSMSVQAIKNDTIERLEPGLANQSKRFTQGLYLPNEGQLDNRELLKSLALTIKKRNLAWFRNTPVEHHNNSVTFNNQSKLFDWVIDCRGLGAKTANPTLRGVRGEVIRVHAPEVKLSRPVLLMHPRYPIYIAPKANHHFVIGATQIESEDQRQPTVRSTLELLSSCYSVHKGFAEAEILEVKAGLRPALPDNEPKISVNGQTIQVNGLFRHGYLLTPALVEQCLAVIQNTQTNAKNNVPFQKSAGLPNSDLSPLHNETKSFLQPAVYENVVEQTLERAHG